LPVSLDGAAAAFWVVVALRKIPRKIMSLINAPSILNAAQTGRECTPVGINQLGSQVLDRRAVIITIFTISLNDSTPS